MSSQSFQPTEITFAAAYERLKEITERLNSEEVEADELVALLREAKGLEVVLRDHLTQIDQEVTAIEKGEGIAAYKIVSASDAETTLDAERAAAADAPADVHDFETGGAAAGVGADDDIPF